MQQGIPFDVKLPKAPENAANWSKERFDAELEKFSYYACSTIDRTIKDKLQVVVVLRRRPAMPERALFNPDFLLEAFQECRGGLAEHGILFPHDHKTAGA